MPESQIAGDKFPPQSARDVQFIDNERAVKDLAREPFGIAEAAQSGNASVPFLSSARFADGRPGAGQLLRQGIQFGRRKDLPSDVGDVRFLAFVQDESVMIVVVGEVETPIAPPAAGFET